MSKLILVRHVATDMAGRFCGHLDEGINAAGRAQLERLIDALGKWKFDHVYTSDLQRARQTAEAISLKFDLPLTIRPGLREISFGKWEGLSWNEIEQADAAAAQTWMKEYPYKAAPCGEEYAQFTARVCLEAELLFQSAKKSQDVVVTHAGVMREMLVRQCGVSSESAWSCTKEYGAFVVIDRSSRIISKESCNGGKA